MRNNDQNVLQSQLPKIIIFAGTFEGRCLGEALAQTGAKVYLSVAQDYGKEALQHLAQFSNIKILTGQLTELEMIALFKTEKFDLIIDATHPYAKVVTANLQGAAGATQTKYWRVRREQEDILSSQNKNILLVKNISEAVELLAKTSGKVLVTTGSKDLAAYIGLKNFQERLFVRVLPDEKVIGDCKALGFSAKQIIAMQGPFGLELNRGMLKELACSYLVTKNTGSPGGIKAKLAAAESLGVKVILIEPPEEEASESQSMGYKQVLELLEKEYGLHIAKLNLKAINLDTIEKDTTKKAVIEKEPKEYFPIFLESKGKKALVVGGGKIALRRIKTLLNFAFKVVVVAPKIADEIKNLKETHVRGSRLKLIQRPFDPQDLKGCALVVAITSDRQVNQLVGKLSVAEGIPVSVGDAKEECSFLFPGVVLNQDLVIGISADGKNHGLVKSTVAKLKELI